MWATIGAVSAVIAVGLGIAVWTAVGRILEQVDRIPENTPVAYLQKRLRIPDDPAAGAGRTHRRVVVCVGDSITHGSVSSNYVDLLSSRLDPDEYEIVNAGINGDLAYNVTRRIDEIIECRPDVVTVLIGTNDANAVTNQENLRRYMKDQHLPQTPDAHWYRENLTQIVGQLQSNTNAKIVLLSIPPIGEDPEHSAFIRSKEYGEIVKEIAAGCGVDYLPLGESLVGHLREYPGTPRLSPSHRHRLVVAMVFRRFALRQSYAVISRSNGHTLLTDHLHLNDTAAEMVADLIEGYLRSG